jgi:sodium transport system permease protein
MQWKNVKLIYLREMRDQLRDRRTLFLIAVLPLLLYPLLGTSFFQLSQFLQHHAAKVLVVGEEQLEGMPWLPELVDGDHFAATLFDVPDQQKNLQLVRPDELTGPDRELEQIAAGRGASPEAAAAFEAEVQRMVDSGRVEAVLEFPAGFGDRLREIRRALVEREKSTTVELTQPASYHNPADEKSQLAHLRIDQVVRRWRGAVTEENLSASHVPVEATRPFELRVRDVSHAGQKQAAVWSKILPFFVFIWALTGAFYPAVDLCAGEKERGTLETLLTSPALRREIVWGKLLTVMTFSAVTAMLNLASLGVTGKFVIDQMSQISGLGADSPLAMPPASALFWLAVALVPICALFGALCLACAAFARSTKEGQYYLMPLMLVMMPLMMLPMSPGVELNLGNSLIPITGMVLLLRSVIEGQYHEAFQYVWPVLAVTVSCCLLAIRWAEVQFNSESVLFRESERLELRRWLVHLVRDRGETPSLSQAALCVAIILVVKFFISAATPIDPNEGISFAFLVRTLLVTQIACIFAPAAIMTVMLTRNPLRTLLLERAPKLAHVAAAAALAVVFHPVSVYAGQLIQRVYPVADGMQEMVRGIDAAVSSPESFWIFFGLIAVLGPICEELAFRGFVLSGLRHLGHKWWAIALSAVAFGAVHAFLQQQINAAAVGLAIGYLAVQTGSLIPCIVFHVVHNGLQLLVPWSKDALGENSPRALVEAIGGSEPLVYHPATIAVCAVISAAILWGLHGITYRRTPEEQLEEARQERDSPLVGA